MTFTSNKVINRPLNPFVRISSLSVFYRQDQLMVEALKNVNMEIDCQEFAVLIGPSGCGKTTLLYVLAGLLQPDAGNVWLGGRPVNSCRKDIALILQGYGLLPWKTAEQNALLGLTIRGMPLPKAKQKMRKIFKNLGIENLSSRYPAQLSGGQKQRVAIARAMALNSRLLLMDEPFSSLDDLTRESLQINLLDVWEKTKISILLVTHNIEEAVFLGQKIFVMSKIPGTVAAVVNNPLAGALSSRGKKEFYDKCNYLRSLLH